MSSQLFFGRPWDGRLRVPRLGWFRQLALVNMNQVNADLTDDDMSRFASTMESESSLDEIRRLRAHLDRSERDTRRVLDGAVHDLRAAHRAISISTEILLRDFPSQLDPDTEHAVRELQTGVAKMNAILGGVSSYARCASVSNYSFGPVATETALTLALASLETEIRKTGAVVVHGVLPSVVGDIGRLTELFRNLVGNAVKYRGTDVPRVEINASQSSHDWHFSVRDNGIGIDEKYWDGLFVPFRRLHGSEIPGIGLGLAICRKIVEAHRGSIHVESEVGQGTAFVFTLPAEQGPLRGNW
jgi:two-component system, chemotaxis family, sensor kinase Cph1